MRQLLYSFGIVLSYFFPSTLVLTIRRIWSTVYSGWKKREFKYFDGHLTGNVYVRGGKYISIGYQTLVEDGVRFLASDSRGEQHFKPEITIGRNSVIQKNCFLSAINKIQIGDNVAVTEHTIILDNTHGDFQDNHLTFNENSEIPDVFLQNVFSRPLSSKGPVVIENDVHIGMFCLIMPGTVIGHHSVIAAHSVVYGKIPPYSLVAGNPAEVILTFGRKKRKNN